MTYLPCYNSCDTKAFFIKLAHNIVRQTSHTQLLDNRIIKKCFENGLGHCVELVFKNHVMDVVNIFFAELFF